MRFININIRKLPQIILHPYKYSCDSRGYMNRIFVGIVSGNLKRASPAAASRSRTLTAAPAALTSTFPVYRRPLYRAPPAGATSGVTFVRFFSRPPKKSKEPSLRKKSQRGKYPCPACCRIFNSPKALKDHSLESHSDLVKHDVQCSCGAYFRNMLELNEHINSGQCPHGGKRVTRRVRDKTFLDDWRRERQDRDSFWKMMQNYIGYDVTSMVTLPLLIFEPMTMLQKMAELMEYSFLLELADEREDPHMRLVYTAATWNPFNPMLGETYKMDNHDGITFIAEQVSHHPPMSAAHTENEDFICDITSKLMTKFLRNSVDIYPVGRTRLTLKIQNILFFSSLSRYEVDRDVYKRGIPECGADALRFALVSYTAQSDNINLDIQRVVGYRQWCNKLWNTIRFAMAKLGDDYIPPAEIVPDAMPFSCKWILSVLKKAISETVCEYPSPVEIKGLSTEELTVRNDLVLALPDRIEAIPDGSAAPPKSSGGWRTSSAPRTEIKFDSDGKFGNEYFQQTEESSQFRQEFEMRKMKQDQGLDVISEGLDTLKNMAGDMNKELDGQVPLMDEIDTKVDKATTDLKNTNVRLKDTVNHQCVEEIKVV